MFSTADTIVAIATPRGRGGIGVVRLAGPEATRVAAALTGRGGFEPRHATLARVIDSAAAHVDEVVVTWFAAPHSYTGDDVVEISGHGSPVLLDRIVTLAMDAGARLAEPGEFTFRAYLNGRLDLVQAEAVADLVDAVTPLQARAAMDQLEGTLTQVLGAIDATLFDLSARLEASLDFPDEGFHFITRVEADAGLARVDEDLRALIRAGRAGRVVREGRLVVIAGPPNAGKSSVFNALVGASRAIVTEIAGTTRDVLTERVDIGGVPVTLVDTAGWRETVDRIEAEGVRRAREAQRVAALTLVVIDRSVPFDEQARRVLAETTGDRLIVINKSDLPAAWTAAALATAGVDGDEPVEVSAATGDGLETLKRRLAAALVGGEELRDAPALSNIRHLALAEAAAERLARARAALDSGATEELVLTDITAARQSLEEITGRRTTDDILRHIFEKFCVGK